MREMTIEINHRSWDFAPGFRAIEKEGPENREGTETVARQKVVVIVRI